MSNTRSRAASLIAITGGLVQIVAALAIVFLPVLGDCWMQTGEMICGRRSYMQLGGNALGYSFLILMIGAGVLAAGSAQDSDYRRVFFIRWLGALLSALVAIAAGWGFGIAFAPGALLLLVSALWTRPQQG